MTDPPRRSLLLETLLRVGGGNVAVKISLTGVTPECAATDRAAVGAVTITAWKATATITVMFPAESLATAFLGRLRKMSPSALTYSLSSIVAEYPVMAARKASTWTVTQV